MAKNTYGTIEKEKMPDEARKIYIDAMHKVQDKSSHSKPISELTVKVNIDCADAIKGLKAVQREARGATQALKELSHVLVGVDHG